MNEFDKKFHNVAPQFDYVRLLSAKVNVDRSKVVFDAVYKRDFEREYIKNKSAVLDVVRSLLPPSASVEISARSYSLVAGEVKRVALDFINSYSVMVFSAITEEGVRITTEPACLEICLPEDIAGYAQTSGVIAKLKEHLDERFFVDFNVKVNSIACDESRVLQTLTSKVRALKYTYDRPDEGRVINPLGRIATYGKPVVGVAKYIGDLTESGYACVYGTPTAIREREYVRKKDKQEGADAPKSKFLTFTLSDGTGDLKVSFFPSESAKGAFQGIKEGAYIICEGTLSYDDYVKDGSLKMSLKRYMVCNKTDFKVNNVKMVVPDEYALVFPEPCVSLAQSGLYTTEHKPLTREPVVVVSFRTSKQNKYASGEIIEIGAVKLDDGKITESFSTFIRPHVEMTEEERLSAGVYASEIAGKPYIEDVLPDFFKFFDGYTVTAYPVDWHANLLRPLLKKLHIEEPQYAELSALAPNGDFKKQKVVGKAIDVAMRYAKILANE